MKNIQDTLSIQERIASPTPKFFQIIQVIGVVLAAVSGALMYLQENGIVLPDVLVWVADKATMVSGIIATLISQLTVDLKKIGK